jgi:hypothetical protein
MQPTDVSLRPDAAASLPKTAFALAESNTVDLHPRIEDVIDLYNRFIVESDNMPISAWRGPTTPRFKVFDELSFSELFRLNALWHRVKRPHPPAGTDANARHAAPRGAMAKFLLLLGAAIPSRTVDAAVSAGPGGRVPLLQAPVRQARKIGIPGSPARRRLSAMLRPHYPVEAQRNPIDVLLRSSSPNPIGITSRRWSRSPESRACAFGSASVQHGTTHGECSLSSGPTRKASSPPCGQHPNQTCG